MSEEPPGRQRLDGPRFGRHNLTYLLQAPQRKGPDTFPLGIWNASLSHVRQPVIRAIFVIAENGVRDRLDDELEEWS